MRYKILVLMLCFLYIPFSDLKAGFTQSNSLVITPANISRVHRISTLWQASGKIFRVATDESFMVLQTNNRVKIVDIAMGEIRVEVGGGQEEIWNSDEIQFSTDEATMAVYDFAYYTTRVLNTRTGQILSEVIGELRYLSPIGDLVVVYLENANALQVINTTDGTMVYEIAVHNNFNGYSWVNLDVDISPDGRLMLVYDGANYLSQLIELPTGKVITEIEGRLGGGYIQSLKTPFSPDGNWVVLYLADSYKTLLLDTRTGEVATTFDQEVLAFSPDSRLIALLKQYGTIQIQTIGRGENLLELNDVYTSYALFTSDSKFIVIDLWDGMRLVEIANGNTYLVNGAEFSPDMKLGIVYHRDTQVQQLIEISTGTILLETKGDRWNYPLEFSPDSYWVTSFDYRNHKTLLYDASTGDLAHEFAGVWPITFSPSGKYIFTALDFFVDVYALPEARVDTMPAPRSDAMGIAKVMTQRLNIREHPNTSARIVGTLYQNTICYVVGRYETWVYAACGWNRNGWVNTGYIEAVEAWDNTPILDPNNPIESLVAISEN